MMIVYAATRSRELTVTQASSALIPFTTAFEGRVLKAYRDSGGVITIGIGFTWLSETFREWWLAHREGRALRMGDTMTVAECTEVLALLIAKEYAPPVVARFAGTARKQHEIDGAIDAVYNFGAGGLRWKWATSLAAGRIHEAASRLRSTATTAGGKTLNGLIRRRDAEARLIETGDYSVANGRPSISTASDAVEAYQRQLATLGYLVESDIDGIAGPLTRAVVKEFQRAEGLRVDGVVGPATRATLKRAVDAKRAAQITTGGAVAGGTGTGVVDTVQAPSAPVESFDWSIVIHAGIVALVVAVLVAAGFFAWRYRGVILRKRTPA